MWTDGSEVVASVFRARLGTGDLLRTSRTFTFLNLLDRRAQNLEFASGLDLLKNGESVASAAQQLLNFADLAQAMLEAESAGSLQHLDLPEQLGRCAASLWDRFVEAAQINGGVPETWASIARNLLANDYAFALFSCAEAKIVQRQLSKLHIEMIIDPMAGSGLHGRLLAQEGLQVHCMDAMPGGAGGICWYPVQRHYLSHCNNEMILPPGRCALFMSWPPRSEAAQMALRSFGCDVLVLVADEGSWHGSQSFHQELQDHWEEILRQPILCWPRQGDTLRILRKKGALIRLKSCNPRVLEKHVEVFEALPAISAAAAAAAFDAAGLSPDFLQNLLQEQQRDTVPEASPLPSLKPTGQGQSSGSPLVISVADALAPAKPRDTRTTVMLRNLPNNYTRLMVVNLLNQEGFKGKFDFLYLPIDFRSKAGLGYAFVNLCDPSFVQQFWKTFDGFTKWVLPSSKVCQVSWSGPHQGQAAHVERYRSSPIMHSSVPDECKSGDPMLWQLLLKT
ncbi:unnamed protein product [Cladocopium goreaui]|uniref:Mei2-like C-terminal RNA recognition motif domain-containing protein n=1 Tax=Cladocopium goreaui TaxID=2562237 RepID=A0A9P1DP23_9DINO|nr:unnamed protein product [Cladocopium goreaui]